MEWNKKGQFLILSTLFFLLLLLFTYSQETGNSYIIKSSRIDILNNIIHETCMVGKLSNGSYIDSRYSNFTLDVKNYCQGFNQTCLLNITKLSSAPTNLSLLNYTFYNYSIKYSFSKFNYSGNFSC